LSSPGPEEIRAEPRSAPEHLPELGLRADQLEEDEVHHLRDVDAGVEHVDRDGDVRRLVLVREGVDQTLRVFRLELERHRDRLRRDEEAVAHGLIERVGVGGHAVLEIEEAVGVAVHLVLGRRGEAHEERIEVVEDGAVLLEHRTVCLVDDHDVEVPHAEAALPVGRLVDQPHHRRIGRDVDAPLGLLLGDEVHGRCVRKEALERVHRLVDERHAVGEEEHALRPVAAHEEIAERDHRARLAGARGHHEQRLAVVVAHEGLGDAADRAHLVVALDDRRADRRRGERAARLAPLDHELELRLLVEPLYPARRIARVVPEPVLVAVGVEDHRPLAELPLQAVGVELGLLLSDARVAARALGLHQRERLAVVAPQHVIDEALARAPRRSGRHAGDREFAIALLVERPAGLLQQQIDEGVAGFRLGVVVRVGLRRSRLLRLGNLGAQARELLVERALVGEERREVLVLLAQARFQRLQLLRCLRRHLRGSRQRGDIEGKARRRPIRAAIRAREPVGDVEQLARRGQRIGLGHRTMAVRGAVAERGNHPRLAEHRLAGGLLEARLVDQRGEVVLVRELQRSVVLERPAHGQLQRAAGIEACRARIGMHRRLGLRRRLEDCRPLALKEVELAHAAATSAQSSINGTASTSPPSGKRSAPPYTTHWRSGRTASHAAWNPRSIRGASPRLTSIAHGLRRPGSFSKRSISAPVAVR
jgi:hypothetical protein